MGRSGDPDRRQVGKPLFDTMKHAFVSWHLTGGLTQLLNNCLMQVPTSLPKLSQKPGQFCLGQLPAAKLNLIVPPYTAHGYQITMFGLE